MEKGFLRYIGVLLLGVILSGCGKKDILVAKVGESEITLQDLQDFQAKLPKAYRSKKTGIEAQRDYLQTLIDRDLLLLEAKSRGLERENSFIREYEKKRDQKLREEYLRREVRDRIQVPDKELRRYFEEQDLGRAIRVSHIRTKTREEAEAALEEIRKGRPFAEVARERSIHKESAAEGGDLGAFFTRDEASRIIGDEVWSMRIGEISDPIRTRGGFYEVIQVTEEKPVDFETWRPRLYRGLFRQKFYEKRDALVEQLAGDLHVRMNPEALRVLLSRFALYGPTNVQVSPTEEKMVFYQFDGGQVTLGDYLRLSKAVRSRFIAPLDSARVVSFVEKYILPEMLLTEGARRVGIDKDQEVALWLKRKREELLIKALRQEEVEEKVTISDDDVREEYRAHPEIYFLPPEIWVREILVGTEEEAQRLLQAIRGGADMAELAAQYTIRKNMKKYKGRFHMHPFEKSIYGPLYEEAKNAELNKLLGPLKVKGGYSIFRVVKRVPKRPEPLESAERRIRAVLRMEREERRFNEFMASLRAKYASQVETFDDALQAVVSGKKVNA